jgi:Protein of unknown function (DUF3307)
MMHPTYNLFLAIYLAHLLTDFVFQAGRDSRKRRGEWRGSVIHGVTHYFTVLATVALADPSRVLTVRFQFVGISLSIVHLLADRAKLSTSKLRVVGHGALAFVLDQAIHLAAVTGAVLFIVHPPFQAFALALAQIRLFQEKILLVMVVYVCVIFGGGYFIRELIGPLWKEEPGEKSGEHDEVINAGLYIGWLERFLVLTALFLQSPGTVGFILAAKSIARYPELKSVRFAEYFLVGTLLSMTIAIGGAIILLKALYGTVVFGK